MEKRNLHLQKKVLPVLFTLLLSVAGMTKGFAQNYDFSAFCETGQTLYYNNTNATNHYVEITFPGDPYHHPYDPYEGVTKPTGNITLPSTVDCHACHALHLPKLDQGHGTVVSDSPTYSFMVTEHADYVANFVDASTVCNVVFELNDSYGDGWTGNMLVAEANGTSQQLTLGDGYSATFNIQFATGDHVTLSWIEGSDLDECSFTVRYGHTGGVILEKPQSSFDSFFSYEFDVDCAAYTYDITATANPAEGGTVSGAGFYDAGQTCTLTATPATGYIFRNWTKDGTVVSQSPTYSFMVTEHADYVANFVDDSMVCNVVFELNDSDGDGWNGNKLVVTANGASQELTLDDGYSATLIIPFATGDHVTLSWILGDYTSECSFMVSYEDERVIYDGAYLDVSFSYTFVMNCTPSLHTIAANVNPAEGGNVSGAGNYYEDQRCTLTATANPGYAFLYWTKNGTPVSNQASYTFHVTEDATYVANFVDDSMVCNVVFDLADSDGDGWTGNQLVVTSNGFSQYLTIEDGYTESYTIPFTKGTSVSLGWITGQYPEDCSFTVSYENGEVFFESSGTLDSSFSHEFDANCGGTNYHTLNVLGYGDGTGGWNLIASPVAGSIEAMAVGNIFAATEYDLYRFDQGEVKEWRNYKSVPFKLENGKGYLYATKEEQTLAFVGTYNEADTQEVPLIYTTTNPSASMHGWNLIGNPFTTNATIGEWSFYRMNSEGSEIIPANSNEQNIAPMEGIFVHADTEGETVTFTSATRATGNSGEIVLNLFSNGVASTSPATTLVDRAIVRMDECRALPKFQIKDNSDKLYIPQNGKDYAVVAVGGNVAHNVFTEMPVNFEAAKNDTYTLSVNVENMDLELLLSAKS